jgi:hypothetical protein
LSDESLGEVSVDGESESGLTIESGSEARETESDEPDHESLEQLADTGKVDKA